MRALSSPPAKAPSPWASWVGTGREPASWPQAQRHITRCRVGVSSLATRPRTHPYCGEPRCRASLQRSSSAPSDLPTCGAQRKPASYTVNSNGRHTLRTQNPRHIQLTQGDQNHETKGMEQESRTNQSSFQDHKIPTPPKSVLAKRRRRCA